MIASNQQTVSPSKHESIAPASVHQRTLEVKRRQRRLASVEAILWGVVALMAATMVGIFVQRATTLFHPAARTSVSFLCLGTALWIAWRHIVAPLRSIPDSKAAEWVDNELPELEERWSTVSRMSQADSSPIASAMLGQVRRETTAMSDRVNPTDIVESGRLIRPLMVCSVVLLTGIAVLAIDWNRNRVMLERFWAPWSQASITHVHAASGDLIVPRGDPLDLIANVRSQSSIPSNATLWLQNRNGESDVVAVDVSAFKDREIDVSAADASGPSAEQGSATFHIASIQDGFQYRWRSGDGQTDWHTVDVVERPEFETTEFEVTPPEYVNQPAYQRDSIPYRFSAVEGSKLRMAFKPTRELSNFTVSMHAGDELLLRNELAPSDDGAFHWETSLRETVTVKIEMVSKDGLRPRHTTACRLNVTPDRPPVASVLLDEDPNVIDEEGKLEIPFEAHDDHGISQAELVVFREGENGPEMVMETPVSLASSPNNRHIRSSAKLDVSQLDMDNGERYTIAIRVTDNRNLPNDQAGDPPADGASDTNHNSPNKEDNPTANGSNAPTDQSAAAESPQENPQSNGNKPTDGPPSKSNPSESNPDGTLPSSPTSPRTQSPANDAKAPVGPDRKPATTQVASDNKQTSSQNVNPNSNNSTRRSDRTELDEQLTLSASVPLRIKDSTSTNDGDSERAMIDTKTLAIVSRMNAVAQMLTDSSELLLGTLDGVEAEPDAIVKHRNDIAKVDDLLFGVEEEVEGLFNLTESTPLSFVGLQMVDIGDGLVTPARGDVLALRKTPQVETEDRLARAYTRVNTARERLRMLTEQVQRVVRDQKLADRTEKIAKMYYIYVKELQSILRVTSANANPIQRKVTELNYDEAYLKRLKEVTELRREMMDELARMLADDPRLRSRYTNLRRRRERNFRVRLGAIHERQEILVEETFGWVESPLEDHAELWLLTMDTQLERSSELVRLATELNDSIKNQLPLALEQESDRVANLLRKSEDVGIGARAVMLELRRLAADGERPGQECTDRCERLGADIEILVSMLEEVAATDSDTAEEIAEYVERRLAEARILSQSAADWIKTVDSMQRQDHARLIAQDQLGIENDMTLLRNEMGDLSDSLPAGLTEFPEDAEELRRRLPKLLESIAFYQTAAGYLAEKGSLDKSLAQQQQAFEALELAVEIFDELRQSLANALDEMEVDDPNAANLVDPTLDQFLRDLEREPNALESLGLGRRRSNLRILSDWQLYRRRLQSGQSAAANARRRAAMAAQMQPPTQLPTDPAESKQARQEMRQAIEQLRQRAGQAQDPKDAERLRRLANELEGAMELDNEADQREKWRRMAHSDRVRAALRNIAAGTPVAGNQWNQLISTLESGLLQSQGRTPPEEFQTAIQQYQNQVRRLRMAPTGDVP